MGLINTVLDLSKIEAGQFSLSMSEYALDSMVENVRVATESLAQGKSLALKTDVAHDLPFGIGDEQRLTQVLLNLVGNAIKFTDVGEVRIAAAVRGGRFAVAVTDTGPGIPPKSSTRSSRSSTRSTTPTPRRKGGTGLGLAIAKQIVEMHGGRIWVEFEPGQGLDVPHGAPRSRRSRRRCRMTQAHSCRRRPGRSRAPSCAIFLQASGYDIVEAVDGGEGVAKARSERPDLILMDIQLPVLDGYEATRQIKADPDLSCNAGHRRQLVRDEGR